MAFAERLRKIKETMKPLRIGDRVTVTTAIIYETGIVVSYRRLKDTSILYKVVFTPIEGGYRNYLRDELQFIERLSTEQLLTHSLEIVRKIGIERQRNKSITSR